MIYIAFGATILSNNLVILPYLFIICKVYAHLVKNVINQFTRVLKIRVFKVKSLAIITNDELEHETNISIEDKSKHYSDII